MIAVMTVLAFATLGQAPAQPATLGLDDIIRGIQKNDETWHKQKSWMVRYVHSREQIDPPPNFLVLYGDNRMVAARKGPCLFASEDQLMVDNPARITGRKTWVLWKDGQYTDRDHNNVTILSKAPAPGEGNLALNTFYYPNTLMRDFLTDTFDFPDELWETEEFSLMLPRCLVKHRAEYRVRKELEDVDSFPCHVVERPGKDVIWIDEHCGFNFRRRRGFQPSGSILYEGKASSFEEKAPGIWLPQRQIGIAYNPDAAPEPYRGKIMRVVTNTVQEVRFNDLPDDFFEIPQPQGVLVHDLRKTKSH
jgi:hypothetical protein